MRKEKKKTRSDSFSLIVDLHSSWAAENLFHLKKIDIAQDERANFLSFTQVAWYQKNSFADDTINYDSNLAGFNRILTLDTFLFINIPV